MGNVVGRYESDSCLRTFHEGQGPKTPQESRVLLTGSHFDTVRNGGKYDGRLGIYVPFAEEVGQRYKATFLGSSALTGNFNPEWLDQLDVASHGGYAKRTRWVYQCGARALHLFAGPARTVGRAARRVGPRHAARRRRIHPVARRPGAPTP